MSRPIGQLSGCFGSAGGRARRVLLSMFLIVALAAGSGAQRQGPSTRTRAPSNAIEFRSVKDNVPLGLRDTAALVRLLRQARQIKPDRQAKEDQSEATLQQTQEHPERLRGAAVRVEGIVRRLFSSQTPVSTSNRLFEIWITPAGKGPSPVACLVEELPEGFPDRPVISEHAVVRGFFLKQMSYKVGDKEYQVPLLVGTLEHRPRPNEDVIEPPRDEVFVRLPEGSDDRSVGPPVEEKFTLKLERNGRVTFDGDAFPRRGLARKLEQLAASIRSNIRAGGVLLPADRELPVAVTLRAPDETPCALVCSMMLECQTYGFLKYTLELESGNDPPVAQPANSASPPPGPRASNLPEEQRTIQLRIRADQRGQIAWFQLGDRTLYGSDALSRELMAIVKDPNSPYDRAEVELDPRLKFAGMVRVARVLATPVMTRVRFTPVEAAGGR